MKRSKTNFLAVILLRTLFFPFFFGMAFVSAFAIFFIWIKNFILYGGEAIAYSSKNEKKTIADVYYKLKEIQNEKI